MKTPPKLLLWHIRNDIFAYKYIWKGDLVAALSVRNISRQAIWRDLDPNRQSEGLSCWVALFSHSFCRSIISNRYIKESPKSQIHWAPSIWCTKYLLNWHSVQLRKKVLKLFGWRQELSLTAEWPCVQSTTTNQLLFGLIIEANLNKLWYWPTSVYKCGGRTNGGTQPGVVSPAPPAAAVTGLRPGAQTPSSRRRVSP